jgi:hypothetical protein
MRYSIIIATALLFSACCTRKSTQSKQQNAIASKSLPAAIVYKTKANYSMLVPVGLSADKKEIVSYPDPKDVKDDSGFYYPTALKNGYWMDNIGVGGNTGYLGMSLKEYSQLKEPLSLAEMMAILVDAAPFTEMWNCGNRGLVSVDELNVWIKNGELDKKGKRIFP